MSFGTCLRRTALPRGRFTTTPHIPSLRTGLSAITMSQRPYATESDLLKEQPGDEKDDVVFKQTYGLRTIELNRPKKLNSLNGSMCRKIIPRLQEWTNSQMTNAVLIKGNGRAFCAGGDVAALAEWNSEGPKGQQASKDYFALEYKLDHLIATYPKPYIAFMDGITMGGGVGLSVHAPFRIATENTLFAMPETTIGFFPDVGASFFLPRMDGALGTYLALTSEQLKGVDVFYHGIATHYLHSSSLPELESRLGELNFKDYSSLNKRNAVISATIEEFATSLPSPRPHLSLQLREAIDMIFGCTTMVEILAGLEKVAGSKNEQLAPWAKRTLDTIQQRSPTSVAVALRQMLVGGQWDIAETFRREHAIASRFMEHNDFIEGVTARLVRRQKERPNWQPRVLDDIRQPDIDRFFDVDRSNPLRLLNEDESRVYREYPHMFGLPSEKEIDYVLKGGEEGERLFRKGEKEGGRSPEEALSHLMQRWDGKQGVKEKVMEYFERRKLVPQGANL